MTVLEIAAERKSRFETEAETLRHHLSDQCTIAIEEIGDDIAGYAFVVWNRVGELKTVYNATHDPIRPQILPAMVSDALNRHVTIMLAREAAEKERP